MAISPNGSTLPVLVVPALATTMSVLAARMSKGVKQADGSVRLPAVLHPFLGEVLVGGPTT